MHDVDSEIKLIETISHTKVMAIALSHENLTEDEVLRFIANYERRFKLPTTDVLSYGCKKLIETLLQQFPYLEQQPKQQNGDNTQALVA
jgi:uncharacterized NAD-dependent epimerase/dehydratase family protein